MTDSNTLIVDLAAPTEDLVATIRETILNESKYTPHDMDLHEEQDQKSGASRENRLTRFIVRTAEGLELRLASGFRSLLAVLGAKRSILTAEDKPIETINAERARTAGAAFVQKKFPERLSYRDQMLPIRNQGAKQGSCVAQTAACMKEWQFNRDEGYLTAFSPQFVYDNRADHSIPAMSAKEMLQILTRSGDCFEKTYPYGNGRKASAIPHSVKQEALKHRISSYAPVTTIEGAKRALFENGPLTILVPCYNFGMRMWKKGGQDSDNGAFGGIGHAFTIVGYDENGFELRNSWGPDWGSDQGHCWFPESDWDLKWEVWTTIS